MNYTYMSIIISLRKTPSARSVIDSISALALKVLLAYNNEKIVSQNRVFYTIARSKLAQRWPVLHQHCLQTLWSRTNSDESKDLLTQTTSGLWRNPTAVAMLLHDPKNGKLFPKKFTVTVYGVRSNHRAYRISPHWTSDGPSDQNITLRIEICTIRGCQSYREPIRNSAIT